MKPHMRCIGEVWSCASYEVVKPEFLSAPVVWWRIGYGYTQQEAWADWEGQA